MAREFYHPLRFTDTAAERNRLALEAFLNSYVVRLQVDGTVDLPAGSTMGGSAIGGATQLSELSDVNTSTPTNRNALMADGVDWESRALVEADISDLAHFSGLHADLTDVSSSQHHTRYADSEAVSAMGVKGDTNPLNHDRYTDAEAATQADAQIAAASIADLLVHSHAALSGVGSSDHHTRYADSEAVSAMGAKANSNALNHDRYADSEAVTAMGAKANSNALNHDRYTDSEADARIALADLADLATKPANILTGGIKMVSLTISSGTISISSYPETWLYITVDTEGGAGTDDLNNITGGTEGQIVVLRTADNTRDVTIKYATSAMMPTGKADFTLSNVKDSAMFIYNGSQWVGLAVSDNV
jgi:hypothetical protein